MSSVFEINAMSWEMWPLYLQSYIYLHPELHFQVCLEVQHITTGAVQCSTSKYVSEEKTYASTRTTWPLNIKVDLFHQVVNHQVAK